MGGGRDGVGGLDGGGLTVDPYKIWKIVQTSEQILATPLMALEKRIN